VIEKNLLLPKSLFGQKALAFYLQKQAVGLIFYGLLLIQKRKTPGSLGLLPILPGATAKKRGGPFLGQIKISIF
jgi:hypothetical protein